ncbi:MAG TPA: cupin domain-containing protein [Dehalococcoidia bacterium]|nr:cupin domain-containing protein [Dehalococcoidia bacterium]
MTDSRVTFEDALQRAHLNRQAHYAEPLTHGTLKLGMYAPYGKDPQQPHEQDEVYIVMKGNGTFVVGDDRMPFEAGDALFVPAGVDHRFEHFSDDFATWVIFYGPEGGEAAT